MKKVLLYVVLFVFFSQFSSGQASAKTQLLNESWSHQFKNQSIGDITVGSTGNVIVPFREDYVGVGKWVSYSPNGKKLWEINNAGVGTFSANKETLVIYNKQNFKMYIHNLKNGSLKGSFSLPKQNGEHFNVIVDNDYIYIYQNRTSKLYVYNLKGVKVGSYQSPYEWITGMKVRNGNVYLSEYSVYGKSGFSSPNATYEGQVTMIDKNGKVLWNYNVSPIQSGDFHVSEQGEVYLFKYNQISKLNNTGKLVQKNDTFEYLALGVDTSESSSDALLITSEYRDKKPHEIIYGITADTLQPVFKQSMNLLSGTLQQIDASTMRSQYVRGVKVTPQGIFLGVNVDDYSSHTGGGYVLNYIPNGKKPRKILEKKHFFADIIFDDYNRAYVLTNKEDNLIGKGELTVVHSDGTVLQQVSYPKSGVSMAKSNDRIYIATVDKLYSYTCSGCTKKP